MIKADRELLARLSLVNQNMGQIVLRLLSDAYHDADLTAPDLRSVGGGLLTLACELAEVGTAMVGRADQLDDTPQLAAALAEVVSSVSAAAPDLARDPVIHLDRISDHVALLAEIGRLNGQRADDTGYWWEFIGPVIGTSPEWGYTRPVLAVGVRGESGILIWAEHADPEPHAVPEVTGPTNDRAVTYTRVAHAHPVQRLRVPAGREIPLAEVLSALAQFCETGQRPDCVQWRAVDYDTAYGPDSRDAPTQEDRHGQ